MPDGRRSVRGPLLWFDLPLIALALSALVGLRVAWDAHSAVWAAAWLWAAVALGLATSRVSRADTAWRALALLATVAGAGIALYVVFQFKYLGYDVKVTALHRFGVLVGGLLPRIATWAPMPNTVATFLEGLVPLAVALAIGSMRVWSLNPLKAEFYDGVAAASAAAMVAAILLVSSRGAWVALGVGSLAAIVAWGLGPRAGLAGKITAVAAAVLGLVVVGTALHVIEPSVNGFRLSSIFDRPDRLNVYRNSLVLINDFPFTGVGPGDQFTMALSRYALLISVPFLTYAHNLYLGVWLELGVLGMMALAALLGSLLVAITVGERAQAGAWFRGAWVGALAILVHGSMDARQLVDRWTWLPLFLLLGLAAARLVRRGVRPPAVAFLVPVAAVATFVAAAWPALAPVASTWKTNQGMLAEAQAELGDHPVEARARLLADARAAFEAAAALEPNDPTARRRLGVMAINDGSYESAYAHLQASWRAEPGNPATRKALGLACAWTGRIPCARQMLEPIDGMFDELNTWSWYWEQRGRPEQAIYATRVAQALSPRNPQVARRLEDLQRRAADGRH